MGNFINFLLKLPALVLGFLVLLLYRKGGLDGTEVVLAPGANLNAGIFCTVVAYGYFLVILLQAIGAIGGDVAPVTSVISDFLGFFLYMSAGSIIISSYAGLEPAEDDEVDVDALKSKALATGAMMILQSLAMLIFAGLTLFILRKARMER